ncbi:MAG: glutamine amidotransferase [Deltaproteobacteria bacterium]|nr:MAG: glutamine amidotransferase [Deltaproteobacteria bacterium]
MKPLLIIKMGHTMPHLAKRRGDFEDWIVLPLKGQDLTIAIVSPYTGEPLPRPEHFSGIIITGSHAMVTDREAWSEHTAAWVPRVIEAGVPLLGICYGHQLLANALGGVVGSSPIGIELGTVNVRLNGDAAKDPLFKYTPTAFKAHASHSQSVIQLPPDAVLLASSKNEPNHAFSIGPHAWGLQFHPEFDADIMKTYIHEFAGLMETHGQAPQTAVDAVVETPHSRSLLQRFAKIAMAHEI